MIAGTRVGGTPLMMMHARRALIQRSIPLLACVCTKPAITELARFNDSIKTDHCRIITILVASSTAANSVPTPKPRNERLSHPISSWLVTVTTASTALLSPRWLTFPVSTDSPRQL
ncbi:hypothetical protein Forpi1262_v002492 [Fusarium oxysporum f. sp. raphani]|uniref:Uncharacterized protein n=1 Tax=Fusarium oxysporum f. sp. raphani TaxID=96318 RepID=A0A8J5UCE2_FUSOX|nr:hypothetical protein Forpi1262_v002492 [Fusarium oxysporum f. sp. raphani]